MSLSSTTNRVSNTGNGNVDTYSYTFRILAETDLLVTVRDTSDVETTLTLTTDYTVSGVGDAGGGSVALVNSGQAWLDADGDLKSSYILTIRRVRPLKQETDIRNQGIFYPETHEDAFDHFIMVDQQQQDELDRSVKLPETLTSSDFDPTLPADLGSAGGLVLTVNDTGTAWADIADWPIASGLTSATTIATAVATHAALTATHGVSGAIVGTTDTQSLSNKSLQDSTTYIVDNADATKKLQFQVSGITTGTTRTLTVPDADTTVVGTDTTQTLTNKTFDAEGTGNSLTNVKNANIKAAAAIDRSKLASGTASHVVINDGSGVMSSEAQLAITRGGTGQATANAALNALLPSQTSNSGKFLTTNGTDSSWAAAAGTALALANKTSNYTLTASDDIITADTSGGAFALTLPTSVGNTGKVFRIILKTAGNVLTINTTSAQTIGGYASGVIKLGTANDEITVVADGTNWQIANFNVCHAVRYTNTAGTGIGAGPTTVPFATKDYDALSLFATDTFTAQVAGKYMVVSNILTASQTLTTGQSVVAKILKNGSAFGQTARTWGNGNTVGWSVSISGIVDLAVGGTIKIQAQSIAGTTIDTTAGSNEVMITRIGN